MGEAAGQKRDMQLEALQTLCPDSEDLLPISPGGDKPEKEGSEEETQGRALCRGEEEGGRN